MDAARLVMLAALLVLLTHRTHGFKWTSAIQHGANISRCVGENVTFPWSFDTEGYETVVVRFWFTNKNGSFASHVAHQFLASSPRVTQTGNAGITLSDVSKQDDDTYGVSIRLAGKLELMMQSATLSVMEPPRTTDGQFRIAQPEREVGNATRLTCGKFVSLGNPPTSVLWTDPTGRTLQSTHFLDGVFSLELPPSAKGGNYTCYLPSRSTTCLPSDSSLLVGTSVLVKTVATVYRQQAEDLDALEQEVEKVKGVNHVTETVSQSQADAIKNLQSLVNQQLHAIQEQNTQISSFQNQVSELQQLTRNQNTQISSFQNQVLELQQLTSDQNNQIYSLQNQLTDLQNVTTDLQQLTRDHNTQISSFQNQVLELQQLTSDQNNQIYSFQNQITDLQNVTTDLQQLTRDQNTQISSFQNQVSKLQQLPRDQNNQIYSFQNQVSELQQLTRDQNTQISSFQNQVSELQQLTRDHNTEVSRLQNQLTDLQNVTTDLQHNTLATKKTDTVVEGYVTSLLTSFGAAMTRVEQVEQQLKQQNVTVTSLQASVASLQTNVDQLRSAQSTLPPPDLHDAKNPVSNNSSVRLVGGSNAREGRVEVLIGNQWGTICDDNWDKKDAMVICGMLGYSRNNAVAWPNAAFGEGSGPIVLDEVACRGNETDIRLCDYNALGTHNCRHSEDASVICQP